MMRSWRLWRQAALLLPAVLWTSCREPPQSNQKNAPRAGMASARLAIEPSRHDFGSVVQGTRLHHVFGVRNLGTSRLELQSAGPVLSCSARAEPAVLEAGGQGQLAVTCTPEFHGPLRVSLPVSWNGAGSSEILIEAQVVPLLSFDAPLLDMKFAHGEQRTLEVRLTGALAGRARLGVKEAGACGFQIQPLLTATGQTSGLRVTSKDAKVGTHAGNLLFSTGLEQPAEIALPYSCRVTGTLSVSPTNPYFNLRLPGPKLRILEVKSSAPRFELQAAEVVEGPFAATFERAPEGGAYRVTVRVLEEQLGEARGVVGTLRLRSNDRSELVRDVPLLAVGRLNAAEGPTSGVAGTHANSHLMQ